MAESKMSLRAKLIVLTAVMASLLEIIDTAIVNVAIPSMMGNLGATIDEISWVSTGYIIANAIVLPIAGWMSEQIGRKVYYTSCIAIFTFSSVCCGLSNSLHMLIFFRVIQGLAGGALLPTSQSLIYESFPKEQAGMASAIYGMSVMIGPTLGPVLGGFLTDNFGWRSIFNVNLPLGIIVMALSYFLVEEVGFDPNAVFRKKSSLPTELPEKPKSKRTPVDIWGLLFLVVGIGCMQYVLERGHADDWFDSKTILICSIFAVLSLAALIWWELRTEFPILQLRHFRDKTFRSGIFLMMGLGAILYGLIFIVPIFVTQIQGLTATQTGILFIPGALMGGLLMPIIGKQLRAGRDPRYLITIGVLLLSFAVFRVAGFDSDTSVGGMFWPLLFRGIALSFLFVPINTSVLTRFSGVAIGQAAGMLNLCRQIGGSIAIAGISTMLQSYQVANYTMLSAHVTWFDSAAVHGFYQMQSGLGAKFATAVGMGKISPALKILYFRTRQQAFVLAFQKALKILVLVFSLTLIPTFLMKRAKVANAPLPDAH